MSLATELQQTVLEILEEFAPNSQTCYKRTITRTGSFELIGRDSSTFVDTILDPQPVYKRIGNVVNERFHTNVVLNTTKNVVIDDWIFVLSVAAITKDELINKNVVLVLKDTLGNEEIFRLIDFIAPGVNATEVCYLGFYRSVDR